MKSIFYTAPSGDPIVISFVNSSQGVDLSLDHRVIDGALGAEFLAVLRTTLESPKFSALSLMS